MDLTTRSPLPGKYFISSVQSPSGAGVIRGRVIALVQDFMPFYLCELLPCDDDVIAVTTETVLALEQLVGVYLFSDRALFDAAWRQTKAQMEEQRQAQRQAQDRRAAAARVAQGEGGVAAVLTSMGVRAVSVEEIEQLFGGGGGDGRDGRDGAKADAPKAKKPRAPRAPRAPRP